MGRTLSLYLRVVFRIKSPQTSAGTGVLNLVDLESSNLVIKGRTAFTGYIGDYDGSPDMNEENMMKEIRARGPIIVGMVFPYFFQFYEEGVLECNQQLLPDSKFNEDQTDILRRIRDEFRLQEHLVMILGWGETKAGEKYWIVQNS